MYDQLSDTNMIDFTEELRSHDHEEADTLLLLHAIDVVQKDPFRECIMFSPDTDLFLHLLHYYESLPQITTFRTGRGNDKRDISIKNCFEVIGSDHAKAILGFHVFTGCDQTGRFNGKSKSSWWMVFMEAVDPILQALSALGNGEDLPNLSTLENLECFVVQMYGGNKTPKDITTIAKLRWFLFSKFQHDACPEIQDFSKSLCNNGWELNGSSLQLIMTNNLPAPLALIELRVCRCKNNCSIRRSKRLKNELICTDMCKCSSCKNTDSFEGSNDEIEWNDSECEDDE